MDSVIVSVIIIAGILAIPAWLIYAIAGERGRIAGIALVVTVIAGIFGMAIGHEFLGGFPEFGTIVAIVVMGAFIIGNQKK